MTPHRPALVLALVLVSCTSEAPTDAGPDDVGVDAWVRPVRRELDLLFVIDDSGSMSEEQASLVTETPRILSILASGQDSLGRVADFPPVQSLHVGLVTTDMGIGNVTGITGCPPGFGDDGVMQFRTRHPNAWCMTEDYAAAYPDTPNVFDFEAASGRDIGAFATDVGCVATIGTAGCGFEMSLESMLKALSPEPLAEGAAPLSWTSPRYHAPTFWGGTFGHGEDEATNGAFLRPDSVLAIVIIGDEDDGATPNPEIFSMGNPAYTGDLNMRAYNYQSELYPIERYVDGILGLRRDPAALVFASIAGVPPDLVGRPIDLVLADERMHAHPDPANPLHAMSTTCVSPGGRGVAYPAERITEVASGLHDQGARVSVQSICATSFTAAFDDILGQIGDALAARPVR